VAAQDQLRIEARKDSGGLVLSLRGELDLATAPLLQKELESGDADATAKVVLDLQELEFIDSTGLRTILWAHERSRESGGEFAVTPGSPQVQRLLAVTRAGEYLRIVTSPDEALEHP
jgi:anti-sigma B factor antagonist